jgi:formylglycine-generating enzyme required for sulfatase activity
MMNRILLSTLCALALAGCTAWLCAQPMAAAKRYALLVGVNDYDHADLPKLRYAVNDATVLRDVLAQAGYEVVLLTAVEGRRDPACHPTKTNIETQLRRLVGKFRKGDTLLLGLAGHGLQFEGNDDSYFCPQDARPFRDRTDTLVSVKWVYERLYKDAAAGAKLVLVDACRNDPKAGRGRGIDADSAPAPPKGVGVLLSCSAGEKAYEHDKYEHGVFFHHVIAGLKGAAEDKNGEVTWDDLRKYVKQKVTREVPGLIGGGAEQTPEESGRLAGIPPVLVSSAVRRPEGLRPALLGAPFSAAQARQAQQAWAQYLSRPVAEALDLGGGVQLEVMLIPPGTFLMGSHNFYRPVPDEKPEEDQEAEDDEKPQHAVTISQPFWLGKYEVTVGQFRRFISNTGYRTEAETDGRGGWGFNESKDQWESGKQYTWKNPGYAQTEAHPVANVSWNDAKAFCDWLGQKVGGNVRLCREAEWEYSCRAGTTTRYSNGNDAEALAAVGNVADSMAKKKFPDWTTITARDGYVFTAPVGRFQANAFGLHDQHGNVWEWCEDWYDKDYYRDSPTEDPAGPGAGRFRVLRGGSFSHDPRNCRAAHRDAVLSTFRRASIGFRVLLTR